jgi:hypothetical protein
MAVSAPTLTNTAGQPTKTGWHLVTFLNGDYGAAQWNGSKWNWGSLTPPNSPITGFTWIGNTIQDVNSRTTSSGTSLFAHALAGLYNNGFTTAVRNLTAALDHGNFGLQGQPVLWNKGGQAVGNTNISGSEATPTNIIPSPIPATAGNSSLTGLLSAFGVFTTLGFWKGIGLVLAGAAILVFAALEFRKIT